MVVIRVQNTHCHLSKNTGWDPPVSSFLNLQRPHLHHGRAAPPVTCAPRRFPFLHKCAINAPASPPLFPLPETAAPRLHRAPPALMVVARASPSTASAAPPPLPPPPYKRCARPPAPPTPPPRPFLAPQRRRCRMDFPGPNTSVGTGTDYSEGPWDYPTCAPRHLLACTRTTEEKYSDRKLYMSHTV
jgi:hypothetical protein